MSGARAKRMDDPYGAFCRDTHVALAGAPEGPLAGLRFGVKDIYHIARRGADLMLLGLARRLMAGWDGT